MDLLLIYYFTALEKYRNFSVAADELYLSQSSLSKRIKSLETKLDVDLFVRHSRSIELTEAGRAILPHARNISNEYDKMNAAISKFSGGCSMFRISAISFLSYYGMMNGISDFIKKNPEVNLNIKECNSREGMEMLDSDRVDACMMFSKLVPAERYNKYPLVQDRMMALMNETHPLASVEHISLEQLGEQELVLISERDEPFFKQFILEEFDKRGIRPNFRAYGVWISAIWAVVRQSSCVSILPRQVAERLQGNGIVCREIEELPFFYFSLVTKCDSTKKILPDFIRCMKENGATKGKK
ncbi:MAG: LysR family transcriptional regulator [Lachnospiraceae bacterium]|nr:LysR family transcriptional regulator [Lachnospiraceae bacterium]